MYSRLAPCSLCSLDDISWSLCCWVLSWLMWCWGWYPGGPVARLGKSSSSTLIKTAAAKPELPRLVQPCISLCLSFWAPGTLEHVPHVWLPQHFCFSLTCLSRKSFKRILDCIVFQVGPLPLYHTLTYSLWLLWLDSSFTFTIFHSVCDSLWAVISSFFTDRALASVIQAWTTRARLSKLMSKVATDVCAVCAQQALSCPVVSCPLVCLGPTMSLPWPFCLFFHQHHFLENHTLTSHNDSQLTSHNDSHCLSVLSTFCNPSLAVLDFSSLHVTCFFFFNKDYLFYGCGWFTCKYVCTSWCAFKKCFWRPGEGFGIAWNSSL